MQFGVTDTKKIPFIDRNVSAIVIHPSYKKIRLGLSFDIALLKLDRSINFQKNIIPICMPTASDTMIGELLNISTISHF